MSDQPTLNIEAQLVCPHQGTVVINAIPKPVNVAGSPVLLKSEATTIAGCLFTLPNGQPSPCVSVKWSKTDSLVKTMYGATLSRSSIGLCMSANGAPQGFVFVRSNQTKTSSR